MSLTDFIQLLHGETLITQLEMYTDNLVLHDGFSHETIQFMWKFDDIGFKLQNSEKKEQTARKPTFYRNKLKKN